jgi:5-methylcytosine-specific restriction endonuclease McrA
MEIKRPKKDLSGTKINKLTVIKFIEYRKNKPIYECKCDCGVVKEMSINYRIKSCGCELERFRKEILPEKTAKRNERTNVEFNTVFNAYKQRARKKKIVFDLSKEDFEIVIKANCTYCGVEPENYIEPRGKFIKRDKYYYNGIDRLDNSIGYTYENCVPCCEKCNKAKRDMPKTEFLEWMVRMVLYFNINVLKIH